MPVRADASELFDLDGNKLDDYAAAAYRNARREDFAECFAEDASSISSASTATPVSMRYIKKNTNNVLTSLEKQGQPT